MSVQDVGDGLIAMENQTPRCPGRWSLGTMFFRLGAFAHRGSLPAFVGIIASVASVATVG
jgi:hypothetical protein